MPKPILTSMTSPFSLHDALPISYRRLEDRSCADDRPQDRRAAVPRAGRRGRDRPDLRRSEEHTSELQSRENLVCRLLLEKKNKIKKTANNITKLVNIEQELTNII